MWDWIKEHPIAIIGGLGALVLLYLVVGSSSSSTTTTTNAAYPQPTDAEVQAAAAEQAAQYQLAGQQAQVNAAESVQNAQTGAAVQIAGLQANEQTQQYQAELAANNSNNATTIAVSKVNAQAANYQVEQAANVQQAGIAATQNVQEAAISSQQNIALASDASQVQAEAIAQYAATTQVRSNNAAFVDLAAIQASTAQGNNGSVNYGQSISNLEGAIASTGSEGAGLLPEVKAAASGGANSSVWNTITGIVQNWGSRTTSAGNQAGKATILGALNTPTYNAPTPGNLITNLLPV